MTTQLSGLDRRIEMLGHVFAAWKEEFKAPALTELTADDLALLEGEMDNINEAIDDLFEMVSETEQIVKEW